MRKVPLINDEYYHIYNRGVDKRIIFKDHYDIDRFFKSMILFNNIELSGSIYEQLHSKDNRNNNSNKFGDQVSKDKQLVEIVSYCLNPNHFHFILRQRVDNGISKFIKRLLGGYSYYFNNKNKRSGVLFQGPFKAIHIDSNKYLLHLSAYVNLNDKVHKFGGPTAELIKSSWNEYVQGSKSSQKSDKRICSTDIILEQFNNSKEYELFARDSLKEILKHKEEDDSSQETESADQELNQMLLE